VKRPYITVGFTAFLILATLAVTSPRRVMKRLGGARWQAIHRWVYLAAVLGVFHFLWLVKRDITEPFLAAITLLLLLLLRRATTPARPPTALGYPP
jgi:sulfoxide reductase heme-binding subunit YedZ